MKNKFLIPSVFSLDNIKETVSEEEFLTMLSVQINQMLDTDTDLLFSTLYRLDVEERKIKRVLASNQNKGIGRGLAELVLERQKQRMATKRKYASDNETDEMSFDI